MNMKTMSDYLSDLPVELIDKILDNISSVDILSSMSLVNKRLHSVSLTYSRFRLDFNVIAKKKYQFDLFCNQLANLTSRIVSLTFDNGIMAKTKIVRFSHSITINNTFSKLYSITLHNINSNVWTSIKGRLSSFVSLKSMSIESVYDGESSTIALMSLIFNDLLFSIRSLKHLFLSAAPGFSDAIIILTVSSMQTSTIESLTLKHVRINLHQLFPVTPMLHKLDVLLDHIFYSNIILHPSRNLQQLSVNIEQATMLEMKRLLTPMICLTHLTLHITAVQSDMTDGNAWMQLLHRIVVFKFVFGTISREKINLDSFRTRFWLEEKKWYVTYDQWSKSNIAYLYTNPCCTEHWCRFSYATETLITESTGSEQTTFPNVKYLFIENQSQMENTPWSRFNHLHDLIIERNIDITLEYIVTRVDLSRITSFCYSRSKMETPSNEFIRILHTLPQLRSLGLPISIIVLLFDLKWPQIIELSMGRSDLQQSKSLTSIEIDSFWYSFSHLEYLQFGRENIQDVKRLFDNRTSTLSNVMIDHSDNINDCDPPLITYQWLEKNTRLCHFDYFRNPANIVYMWL